MAETQYEVRARLEYTTTVTVNAETAEEAKAKFEAMDWADDGIDRASCANWVAQGEPVESYRDA